MGNLSRHIASFPSLAKALCLLRSRQGGNVYLRWSRQSRHPHTTSLTQQPADVELGLCESGDLSLERFARGRDLIWTHSVSAHLLVPHHYYDWAGAWQWGERASVGAKKRMKCEYLKPPITSVWRLKLVAAPWNPSIDSNEQEGGTGTARCRRFS